MELQTLENARFLFGQFLPKKPRLGEGSTNGFWCQKKMAEPQKSITIFSCRSCLRVPCDVDSKKLKRVKRSTCIQIPNICSCAQNKLIICFPEECIGPNLCAQFSMTMTCRMLPRYICRRSTLGLIF